MLAMIQVTASSCGQYILTTIAGRTTVASIEHARRQLGWYKDQAEAHGARSNPDWAIQHCWEMADAIERAVQVALDNMTADKRPGRKT